LANKVIIITGPLGSGKTTTVRNFLKTISHVDEKDYHLENAENIIVGKYHNKIVCGLDYLQHRISKRDLMKQLWMTDKNIIMEGFDINQKFVDSLVNNVENVKKKEIHLFLLMTKPEVCKERYVNRSPKFKSIDEHTPHFDTVMRHFKKRCLRFKSILYPDINVKEVFNNELNLREFLYGNQTTKQTMI
jgi:adenylate kinase family enzyme|tara:strand:- start:6480 stop:7046 length:567 start_codon:yes stop_codon:yes gene_type:complete